MLQSLQVQSYRRHQVNGPRMFGIVSLWTLIACIANFGPNLTQAATLELEGKGASLPSNVYVQASLVYGIVQDDVKIVYTKTGSSTGKKLMRDGLSYFAGSDSPIAESYYTTSPDLQMYPTVATAIVPVYNLPGIEKLVLSREALVGIFNGTITNWRDSIITTTNVGVTLPDETIIPMARGDGSGTTSVFSSALAAFSSGWNSVYGIDDEINWNSTVQTKPKSHILLSSVLLTPYSICCKCY